jgi:hypothetical protein
MLHGGGKTPAQTPFLMHNGVIFSRATSSSSIEFDKHLI